MAADHYDIAGTGVGVVEEDALLGPDEVRAGDVVIAMESSGLHSNGFSLVRHVLLQGARMRLEAHVDELGGRWGSACSPHPDLRAGLPVPDRRDGGARLQPRHRAGGLAANLAGCCRRTCPPRWTAAPGARSRSSTWCRSAGRVEPAEMERTFNLGVGMVALVAPSDVDRALALLTARHVPSWVAGEVLPATAPSR
jgi:phosphoribosylformylglycinamidine cyclo-ligase